MKANLKSIISLPAWSHFLKIEEGLLPIPDFDFTKERKVRKGRMNRSNGKDRHNASNASSVPVTVSPIGRKAKAK